MRMLTDGDGWAGYVEAAAEAAMIGGLADWFAVTALFKHPLGIPIPHTAIIPRRKDAIGASLGEFVQDNFFDPDDLAHWVADRAPAEALGRWLAAEGDAGLVSGPALGRLLESMVDGGHHRSMVDAAVERADRFLVDNYEVLRDRIVEEAPIYTPKVLDHHIFTRLHRGVRGVLADMADDPSHELRLRIDAGLRSYAQRLQTNQRLASRVEAVLARAGESLQKRHQPPEPGGPMAGFRSGPFGPPRPSRGGQRDRLHRGPLGFRRHQLPHRAPSRPRPPVHPHQRHPHRRPRRPRHPRNQAAALVAELRPQLVLQHLPGGVARQRAHDLNLLGDLLGHDPRRPEIVPYLSQRKPISARNQLNDCAHPLPPLIVGQPDHPRRQAPSGGRTTDPRSRWPRCSPPCG